MNKKLMTTETYFFLIFVTKMMRSYLDCLKNLEFSFKAYQNYDSLIIIHPEKLNKVFHQERLKENQRFLKNIIIFFNKEINPFLNNLDLYLFDKHSVHIKEFLSLSLTFITQFGFNGNLAFKCFNCIDCFDCGERVNGIHSFCSLEKFLEKIVEFKIKTFKI